MMKNIKELYAYAYACVMKVNLEPSNDQNKTCVKFSSLKYVLSLEIIKLKRKKKISLR